MQSERGQAATTEGQVKLTAAFQTLSQLPLLAEGTTTVQNLATQIQAESISPVEIASLISNTSDQREISVVQAAVALGVVARGVYEMVDIGDGSEATASLEQVVTTHVQMASNETAVLVNTMSESIAHSTLELPTQLHPGKRDELQQFTPFVRKQIPNFDLIVNALVGDTDPSSNPTLRENVSVAIAVGFVVAGAEKQTQVELHTRGERRLTALPTQSRYSRETVAEVAAQGAGQLVEQNLSGLDLSGLRLSGLKLNSASLTNGNLAGADLERADLQHADFTGSDMTATNFERADMKGAKLPGGKLQRSNMRGADLTGADLHEADMIGADLDRVKLEGADLHGANLRGINMERADLEGANLSGAAMQGSHVYNAFMRHANLDGAQLQGANLQLSDLEGASLHGTHFERTNLKGVSLQAAQMQGANLERAHLQGANLEGADLAGAKLFGASFARANLHGTNLEGALYNQFTEWGGFDTLGTGAIFVEVNVEIEIE